MQKSKKRHSHAGEEQILLVGVGAVLGEGVGLVDGKLQGTVVHVGVGGVVNATAHMQDR